MSNSEYGHDFYWQSLINLNFVISEICREEIPFWIQFDGEIPKDAIKGGKEGNQILYIGRAAHNGSLTPGKINGIDKSCFIPWGTVSNLKPEHEILICSSGFNWVAARDGNVPQNAFPAGHSEQGETIFIGRVLHEGSLVVGKVQPSHGVCYISYENKELNFHKYEVFVV
jgi:Protein of unknown function (DUF3421)